MKKQFTAHYFKKNGQYCGYIVELGSETFARCDTLAETKAKVRELIPQALENQRKNLIRGQELLEEAVIVDC